MRSINLPNAHDYPVVTSTLFQDQRSGLGVVEEWLKNPLSPPYFIMAGYAGSGKSYLTAAIVRLAQQVCWDKIAVTSPTHQAKIVLYGQLGLHGVKTEGANVSVSTIHAFLGLKEDIDDDGNIQFVPNGDPRKNGYWDGCSLLVVDEVSMIGKRLMQYIDDAHEVFQGKVLFVGDPAQIPPVDEVEAAPFVMAIDYDPRIHGVYFLREVVRQAKGNPIISIASVLRECLEEEKYPRSYPHLMDFVDGDKIITVRSMNAPECQKKIMDRNALDSPKFLKLLAYRNNTVYELNRFVRGMRLTKEALMSKYCVGESLILTEPMLDETQNAVVLPNNSEVVIQEVSKHMEGDGEYAFEVYHLVVSCDLLEDMTTILLKARPVGDPVYDSIEDLLKTIALSKPKGSFESKSAWMDYYAFKRQFVPVRHSFSLTTHRSQGSTYSYTIINEGDIFSNRKKEEAVRVAYTALTRASEGVIILR